jgi:hypothetical protein
MRRGRRETVTRLGGAGNVTHYDTSLRYARPTFEPSPGHDTSATLHEAEHSRRSTGVTALPCGTYRVGRSGLSVAETAIAPAGGRLGTWWRGGGAIGQLHFVIGVFVIGVPTGTDLQIADSHQPDAFVRARQRPILGDAHRPRPWKFSASPVLTEFLEFGS